MSTCIFRACAAASWMTNETYNPVRFLLVHKAVTKALPVCRSRADDISRGSVHIGGSAIAGWPPRCTTKPRLVESPCCPTSYSRWPCLVEICWV